MTTTGAPAVADEVIPDDLIVQGSECVGFDCVNNEDFSFDTIRLKENNTRIHFDDTSVSTFPTNNWELRANDSASGGKSYFGIVDRGATGSEGDVSLLVDAGAPENSLVVDPSGRLGLGVRNPVLDVHVKTGNTPGTRYDQDGTSGFAPQTWDVAGNESNFFIRDVTGGSRLPFRIRPGAPTSSIDIGGDGQVSIGSASADRRLQVSGDADSSAETSPIMRLADNGASPYAWDVLVQPGHNFLIRDTTGAGNPFKIKANSPTNAFVIDEDGIGLGVGNPSNPIDHSSGARLSAGGAWQNASDRGLKGDFKSIDVQEIMRRVTELPLSEWSYNVEGTSVRHIGPMAQDFYRLFGLGGSSTSISTVDDSGVALASVQALYELLLEQDSELEAQAKEIDELRQQQRSLAARVAELERGPGHE